jgi:hypothetical protein
MAAGITPVIDSEFPLSEIERGESRQVFGKIIIHFQAPPASR